MATVAKGCYTCQFGDDPITPRGRCISCLTGRSYKYKKIKRVPRVSIPKGLTMKDGSPITMEG